MIFNTWTNATHSGEGSKVTYALDGGSYSYYSNIAENDVDNGLVATKFYFDYPSYTAENGEYTNYYRWFIFKDDEGNYYLKNKHTGFILSFYDEVYTHTFGQMGKMLNESEMADSAMIIDRIAAGDNIKMSLFDYGKYINNDSYIAKEARKYRESGVSTFNADENDNILWFNQDAYQEGYVVDGVASLDAEDQASDKITVDNIGNPSQYDSAPSMLNSLDASGYPYVNSITYHDWNRDYGEFEDYPAFGSDSGSLKYLFDEDMTYVTGDDNTELTAENYTSGYYQSVRYDVGDAYGSGLFQKTEDGGMVYSAYTNAAYFDTSEFYTSGSYEAITGQRFQLYDYVIRPYYHYYYDENTTYDEYTGIYDTLLASTRLDTSGSSLFNDSTLRNKLRDYNSYNRNFLPFNYGHNIKSDYITGDYNTASTSGNPVDPVYPDEFDTKDRTKYTSTQQDTPNLPAYYPDVYADTNGDSYTNSQETNMWFGMTMEFDFEVNNNGKIEDENGELKDMVFNFTGDDDVLVYIDNVLVLNVSGTHGAQMATINFATGNVAHPTDYACYPSAGIDDSETSTIKAKFETAYAEANKEGSNSILAGSTLNEDMFSGNTFANGTRHTLKFYYLERGGSRSFCDLYFNMETLPSSGFEVEKQSENAKGENVSSADNGDYRFVITGYTSEGEALTSGTCTYDVIDVETNAVVGANLTVKQGDIFTIKAGQKAVFKDLDVSTQYTITEIVDQHYVEGVTAYYEGEEVGTVPNATNDDHTVQYLLNSYVPVVENETSTVKFVNSVKEVDVTLKYYNREVVSGKPADMGDEPQTFVHKVYSSDIIYTDDAHTDYDISAMILDAAGALQSGEFGSVENLLDDYYVWTSQEAAVEGITAFDDYHTGQKYESTEYHTDQYGNVQTSGEYWVDTETETDGTVVVTSWLFNRPREYTVTVHGLADGADADSVLDTIDGTDKYVAVGSAETIDAYYNQRLGGEFGDDTYAQNGWLYLSNGTFYLDPSSNAMLTGHLYLDGIWYYFNSDGYLCDGEWQHDGTDYKFRFVDGTYAASCWVDDSRNNYARYYIGGARYYFDPTEGDYIGKMTTGWIQLDGTYYFFGDDGVLLDISEPTEATEATESTAATETTEVTESTAATEATEATDPAESTVATEPSEAVSYKATWDTSDAYTVTTAQNAESITQGESFSFTAEATDGYVINAVVVNSQILTPTDGVYTVENVTSDIKILVITYKVETPQYYKVTFADADGSIIDVQYIEAGKVATAPESPSKAGYTFTGWDKAFDSITADVTVTAVYEKNADTPTVSDKGRLKVEVAGGTGFTISFEDGTPRPQGTSYYNTSAPVNADVTVTALSSDGAEFMGWIDATDNRVLSTELTYSFRTSGNNSIKAMFKSVVENANMVMFYVDVSDQQWDVQYYSATDSISFPSTDPMCPGLEFKGWSMTEEEIKAELALGNDVTVLPLWEKQLVYYSVSVENGSVTYSAGTNSEGKYLANSKTTVTANAAADNYEFAYWVDGNGKVRSYSTEYSFYPQADMSLKAVFVEAGTEIEYKALVSVDSFTVVEPYGQITVSWEVPAEEMGVTYIDAGLIAVKSTSYNADSFYHGATLDGMYDKDSPATLSSNTLVWTGPILEGETWYVKAWAQYETADGETVTVYSDMYTIER